MNGKTYKSIEKIRSIEKDDDRKLVCQTLLEIFNAIRKDPFDRTKRKLLLESDDISAKLMPIDGGLDLLFEVGFVEDDDAFFLPENVTDEILKPICDQLSSILSNQKNSTALCSTQPKISALQNHTRDANKSRNAAFAQKLISKLDYVLMHESEPLKRKALSHIPIDRLRSESQMKYDSYKTQTSHGLNLKEFDLRDFLLMELLAWFKNEFFHWIDKPDCESCMQNENMKFLTSDIGNEAETAWMAFNVEVYICLSCGRKTRFARYNHPEKLLETRGGRCGEWANCFYLCLRATDFDARYILDWTDHVWCEAWSESQQRWLHADPCENALDKPLIYELGWSKQLSYVIAFSRLECVDVTFRYSSSKHAQLVKRRNECDEGWLARYTFQMSQKRQAGLSESERSRLQMRRVGEIVEFLTPKLAKEGEYLARQSGSLQWRLQRGEIQQNQVLSAGFTFQIKQDDLIDKKYAISYNPVKDSFQYGPNNEGEGQIKGWKNGAFAYSNIQMKIEHDWKMCYLARTEKSEQAFIEWMFKLEASDQIQIDRIELKFFTACYENGKIDLSIQLVDDGPNEKLMLDKSRPSSTKSLKCDFNESTQTYLIELSQNTSKQQSIKLRADLMSGRGDCAWQHTQLFRTKLNNPSDDSLFKLIFHFK